MRGHAPKPRPATTRRADAAHPDPAPRAVFEHPDLSLAAKGALAVILTRPSGARVSPEYLFSSSGDPMTVVSKAGRAGGGVRSR